MTAMDSPDAAIQDADLIRWLDDELDVLERARIDAALAADPVLMQRLEQLRNRGARLASLLAATDPEPVPASTRPVAASEVIELNAAWAAQQGVEPHIVPPPRPMPGWLRAAATIALLLTASLLVPPVRAWIAGALGPRTGGSEEIGGAAEPGSTMPVDTLVIRFATSGPAFTIEVGSAPAGGRIMVERRAVTEAAAELYTKGGGEDLQRIREDLFRIANTPSSIADYRFVLPLAVNAVTVRVPGREDVVWRFDADESGRTLDLGGESS